MTQPSPDTGKSATTSTGKTGDEPRRRDSAQTRQRLLDAARRRFGLYGYVRTTLRDIAAEAGVNLALIKRYFDSKEGLFEACLAATGDLLPELGDTPQDRAYLVDLLARQLAADAWPDTGEHPILLFTRDTGDPRTGALRRQAVQAYLERLLNVTGHSAAGAPGLAEPDRDTLLRAELVLALGAGIATLRSTVGVSPLLEATAADLGAPLADVIEALFPAPVTRAR